ALSKPAAPMHGRKIRSTAWASVPSIWPASGSNADTSRCASSNGRSAAKRTYIVLVGAPEIIQPLPMALGVGHAQRRPITECRQHGRRARGFHQALEQFVAPLLAIAAVQGTLGMQFQHHVDTFVQQPIG